MEKDEYRGFRKGYRNINSVRGNIVNAFVQIEMLVNAVLTNYFALEERHSDFLTSFLADEYCTVGLKIKVMEKNIKEDKTYKGFYEDLRRLNNIRNMVAHSMPSSFPNKLAVFSSKEMKQVDIGILEKEFKEKDNKVHSSLFGLVGFLINENRKKKGLKPVDVISKLY